MSKMQVYLQFLSIILILFISQPLYAISNRYFFFLDNPEVIEGAGANCVGLQSSDTGKGWIITGGFKGKIKQGNCEVTFRNGVISHKTHCQMSNTSNTVWVGGTPELRASKPHCKNGAF